MTSSPPPVVVARLVASADTGNGLFYPIISGTGDPGATVTVSNGTGSSSVVVGPRGSWTTAQLTWVGTGQSTWTVTQKPLEGSSPNAVTLTSASGAPSTSLGIGSVTGVVITGTPGARVQVDSDTGSQQLTLGADGTATATVGIVSITVRYVDGGNRFGPPRQATLGL